jgi:hypothetical protein
MARNLYGCTSADFTLTSGGRVVAGATATVWTARTGGTQITDLTDVDGGAITSVTSDADGGIRFYGVDGDKDAYWLDTGTGARIAVRPVDLTGETGPTPELSIGTVTTGTAAATITGTAEDPVLNLTLPTAGANGVNTAAIQDGAVTPAKLATSGRFVFPTGAANGFGFTSGASHLSGTGSPEGVVTAAPGSTWLQTDATTDVKGWIRWVKATGTGNTGWQVGADADTGWRALTSFLNGWAGTLYVRRTRDRISWRTSYAGLDNTSATANIFINPQGTLGTAWLPAKYSTLAQEEAVVWTRSITATALGYWYRTMWEAPSTAYRWVLSNFTQEADPATWPTSLPGSAA